MIARTDELSLTILSQGSRVKKIIIYRMMARNRMAWYRRRGWKSRMC